MAAGYRATVNATGALPAVTLSLHSSTPHADLSTANHH